MRNGGVQSIRASPQVASRCRPHDFAREPESISSVRSHQVLVRRVGLVELEHRELGVVPGRDPLVAEVAVDLVDALDAADDQPLQVELGRDPQEEVDVERVVVRHERPGRRAAGERLHHRRLDLEVAAAVEEPPEEADDRRPALEDLAGLGVHGQVEVALAVALLDVLEAVPLLRKRPEAFREKRQGTRLDRKLAGARPEELALDAQPVAEVQRAVELEGRVADGVAA